MSSSIGIEISPDACRVVRIDRSGRHQDVETIVRSFVHTSALDAATLASCGRLPVAVVMWGLHGDHRQTVVTVGSYSRMRREAVNAARQAGVDTRQMLADIAPATLDKSGTRRPMVVALARASDVAAALRPLTAAGVRVRSVVTPALALMSLARLRRRLTPAGMAEAYVALEETTTAIALVRDGALIAGRELGWGFRDEDGLVRSRDDISERLGDAVEAFFGDCGAPPSAVSQVCVCGGLPELRSMTLALTERLDIEVEPLDSLFGIDETRLPSDDFRERAVDLRLAWAAAADRNAPINFLRERRRRLVKTTLTRAAIVAGVATGLGIAWRIQRSTWLEPSKTAPKTRTAVAPPPPPAPKPAPQPAAPIATPIAKPVQPPVPAIAARVAPVTPPPLVLTPVPEPVNVAPPKLAPPKPPPPREAQAPPSRAPIASAPPAAPPVAAPVRRPPPDEAPLPFEASLGTILYGADRKLAIVDGRIVQVGDDVRGARVVDITPNSVLFRDRQGRLRRLSLDDPGR